MSNDFKFGEPAKLVDQVVSWFLLKVSPVNEDGKLPPNGIILYWLVNRLFPKFNVVNPVAPVKLDTLDNWFMSKFTVKFVVPVT